MLGDPALLDLIVQPPSEDVKMDDEEDQRPSKRKTIYPEVLRLISCSLDGFKMMIFALLYPVVTCSNCLGYWFLTQHKPMSEITSGLHRGIYHQGKLRVNRYNPFEAYVGSESIGDEIIIYGRVGMNRAFDGDIVVVELLPQDQWQEEKSMAITYDGLYSL